MTENKRETKIQIDSLSARPLSTIWLIIRQLEPDVSLDLFLMQTAGVIGTLSGDE
jgi:hypothetical protein